MPTYTLPTIEMRGTPRQLGEGHGETLREPIQEFVAHRLDAAQKYLEQRGVTEQADFESPASACLEILKQWDPEGYEEHMGVAAGAEVDAARLYAATNYSDMRDLVLLSRPELAGQTAGDEGCTSFALPVQKTARREVLTGQTWDLHPRDMQYVYAMHRIPENGPETWSVTCAGSPTLIGMNEDGVYVGTTNIKINRVRPGIAYLSLLHRAIRCSDRVAAATAIAEAPRVAAHTYWLVDAGGAIELECRADEHVQRVMDEDALIQTNHCLHDAFAADEAETPSESSLCRLKRATELVDERDTHSVDTIRAMFSDRADDIRSINRYPEDLQYAATNSCVIGIPAARELWACRGPADQGEWITLPFGR